MIPKIIHQTGPSNTDEWHPLWLKCQSSWKTHFSNYEYKFWNDEEIDELVKTNYPEYWEMYQKLPVHIMKIDFVRFCIMDSFGGIYADLDFYCYKNFSEVLVDKSYVVENPYGNDPIENSLMCSAPNSIFFKKCMLKSMNRFNEVMTSDPSKIDFIKKIATDQKYGKILRPYLVFYITGTNLLSTVYRENKSIVSTLDGFCFNNLDYSYDPCFYTKHIHTGTWGKENLAILNKNKDFSVLRNIPVDSYDFYFDYSYGHYKKNYQMDFSKNDAEPLLNLAINYAYT